MQALRPWILSIGLHLVFLVMIGVSFSFSYKPPVQKKVSIVNAVAVNEKEIQQELKKLQEAEKKQEQQKQKELERLEAEKRKREQELEKIRKAKEAEKKRLADAEKKRQVEEKKRKEAEAKRKAEEKKLAEKRKLEEQHRKEAEAKRKAEEQRKAEEAAKRKAAEEERKRIEAEKALQAQLEAEEKARQQAAWEKQAQSEIARYTAIIQQKIEQNWVQPPVKNLSVIVMVRVLPGGSVGNVEIKKSSGDAVFDRSVVSAVYKAEPLPLPADARLFEYFRLLELRFSKTE